VSSRHAFPISSFASDLCFDRCADIFLLPSFYPVLEISHQIVRTCSDTHFGKKIIYAVFGVLSCSGDVITPTTVKNVLLQTLSNA